MIRLIDIKLHNSDRKRLLLVNVYIFSFDCRETFFGTFLSFDSFKSTLIDNKSLY